MGFVDNYNTCGYSPPIYNIATIPKNTTFMDKSMKVVNYLIAFVIKPVEFHLTKCMRGGLANLIETKS
jgi:hypothetical protein